MSRLARVVKEHGAPLLGIAAYFYDPHLRRDCRQARPV